MRKKRTVQISTFVRKSNGDKIGSNSHWFYGVSSGVDHYYDPSTWARHRVPVRSMP